jgi:PAS domain S-box-containing protein
MTAHSSIDIAAASAEIPILNVDDDEAGRYAMSRILRSAGFQVDEAATGAETLRITASKQFSLVILDVNLPDVSGFEICRRLKADPNSSHVPVLHVSATNVSAQAKVRGLESGADGYLVEPVEPEVLVATVRSLLRMRRAEEALRQSEARFRRLANSNIIGITSGKGDRVLEVNRAFLRMLGYADDETAAGPLSYRAVTAPESAEPDRRASEERRLSGESAPYEKYYVRKDGSRAPALVGAARLDDAAGDSWIEFAIDLTERKKLEAQVLEAQKYESLGLMAAGIAHDFNNLLTGIMGSSSLLMEKLPRETLNFELAETILQASEQAANLTRQILAYAGKGRTQVSEFSVSEVIQQIRTLLHSSVPPGVRLEMNLCGDLKPIRADPNQIQQLMINLVTNAGEAVEPGSGEVRVSVMPKGRYVCIEVLDNGHGMDAETQARIFEPFYSTRFIGRGMGLSAVAGIVRSYYGSVHVESAPGMGTLVRVLLPVV